MDTFSFSFLFQRFLQNLYSATTMMTTTMTTSMKWTLRLNVWIMMMIILWTFVSGNKHTRSHLDDAPTAVTYAIAERRTKRNDIYAITSNGNATKCRHFGVRSVRTTRNDAAVWKSICLDAISARMKIWSLSMPWSECGIVYVHD